MAEERLRALCAELGPQAIPLVVNLTDPASVEAMMPRILEATGQLDIFHANAGSYVGGDIVDGDPDAWDRMLNLNVNAVFPLRPRRAAAYDRARDGRYHRDQLGRRIDPGCLGADLYGIETCGSGLHPYGSATDLPARCSHRGAWRPGQSVTAVAPRLAAGQA